LLLRASLVLLRALTSAPSPYTTPFRSLQPRHRFPKNASIFRPVKAGPNGHKRRAIVCTNRNVKGIVPFDYYAAVQVDQLPRILQRQRVRDQCDQILGLDATIQPLGTVEVGARVVNQLIFEGQRDQCGSTPPRFALTP